MHTDHKIRKNTFPPKTTPNIRQILQDKHPVAQNYTGRVADVIPVEEVIYEEISAELIIESAKHTSGSGGPSKITADIWRQMLCSGKFKAFPNQLAEEIACFGRRLCTTDVNFDAIWSFVASRLIPLKKDDNGTRPIGVGEVLRRIVGKSITKVLRDDIQHACGAIQTCSGIQSGIDSAVHAMHNFYQEDWCEVVLLVDADNAFNSLNRKYALENIKQLCPSIYRYIHNTYQKDSKLFLEDGSEILSQEGTTQGDSVAMAMYGIGIRPLIDNLAELCEENQLGQIRYAADSGGAGKLLKLKSWLDMLIKMGLDMVTTQK